MVARAKICGLTRPGDVAAAVSAGARWLGFNFFPESPRYLRPQQAAELAGEVPPDVARVVLVVDADNATLEAILDRMPADMVQLHGSETPERISDIRARFGLPVMKAVGVATSADLPAITRYEAVADHILLDAKPAPGADLPGGNGLAFDWQLIAGRRWRKPWMLAGGLTPENVARAINLTGAARVDVSSGVESAPGVKDPTLIRAFLAAARGD